MRFDDPRIEASRERDREVLSRGYIDLEYILTPLLKQIEESKRYVNEPDSFFEKRSGIVNEEFVGFDVGTKQMWQDRLDKARQEIDQVISLIHDTDRMNRIESLAHEIKSWTKDSNRGYPWDDVALSLLRHPLDVMFDDGVCPICGEKTVTCLFSSPDWTWSTLCGSAGKMTICLHCKTQETKITWKS